MKNFFDDPQFQAELRKQAQAARQAIQRIGQVSQVQRGDCFMMAESDDWTVYWMAVSQHADDPGMWFLVAGDEFPLLGTCDVEIPEDHPLAPLAFRGNIGLWIHQQDIDYDRYVGRLDADSVADLADRLVEMARGNVPQTDHGLVAEANDAYREWIGELSRVADTIQTRLQCEPVVLRNPVLDTAWHQADMRRDQSFMQTDRLAADPAGPPLPGADVPPGLLLETTLPGTLVLQQDADAFDLVYQPQGTEDPPPPLLWANSLRVQAGHWDRGADGVYTWSQPLLQIAGRVSFLWAGKAYHITFRQAADSMIRSPGPAQRE